MRHHPASQERVCSAPGSGLEARNRTFHRMLVDGVTVEYVADGGAGRGAQVRVVDFDTLEADNWLAVNQFTVVENKHERPLDIVLFVNGLALGVIELKNPTDENAVLAGGPLGLLSAAQDHILARRQPCVASGARCFHGRARDRPGTAR